MTLIVTTTRQRVTYSIFYRNKRLEQEFHRRRCCICWGARQLQPLIHIKYMLRSPGQGVCWVRMLSRKHFEKGLNVLPTIIDEIARVNEIVDGLTDGGKTGYLCRTMWAGATITHNYNKFSWPIALDKTFLFAFLHIKPVQKRGLQ